MLESFLQISVRIIFVLVAANLIGMQATRPMYLIREHLNAKFLDFI